MAKGLEPRVVRKKKLIKNIKPITENEEWSVMLDLRQTLGFRLLAY